MRVKKLIDQLMSFEYLKKYFDEPHPCTLCVNRVRCETKWLACERFYRFIIEDGKLDRRIPCRPERSWYNLTFASYLQRPLSVLVKRRLKKLHLEDMVKPWTIPAIS